jgi:hypothetical protein
MLESTVASGVLMLAIALGLDWGGIGPSSIRDRIALVVAMSGAYALWAFTPAVDAVADAISNGITAALVAAGADPGRNGASTLVTALVSVLAFVAFLGLWFDGHPDHGTRSDGRARGGWLRALSSKVSLQCKDDRRLNPRVWLLGVPIGALAPLTGGLVGTALQSTLSVVPGVITTIITALFVESPL